MNLLEKLNTTPEIIDFSDVIEFIDANFNFTPTRFTNGDTVNEAGQNNGSCKIFSFASLQNLTQDQTLALFGDYYRTDVLANPEGTDHQNIRNFMQTGWEGILFEGEALRPKN
ncbi:HopJ type III effector protein [Algoriphagus ratkowskyi]|uniref:HopJ type III effector protein n=1 Tax=Algoriphagus ratkowskyi TaxID=57028 RepID=A0A2W7RY99_9BACT|nr:HopJ type III effector protein [Algoriphagus ratkowskyi]PZX55875.1 HopJ type III effector protein [Algoriphagus ratkowskyi]TXD77304.1 HopJ type III effector protein [Algoriphagus ratkowskyi]